MSTIQRITKNTVVLLITRVLTYTLGFFYMMYLARYLGVTNFGIISLSLAFTSIFGILTDFGLRPLIVREIARNKTTVNKYLSNTTLMKIILSVITVFLVLLVVEVIDYPIQTREVILILTISVILNSFTQTIYSVFQAYERMEYESFGQILNNICMFSGIMFAINQKQDLFCFALIYPLSNFIVLIFSYAILKQKINNPSVKWSFYKIELNWDFWVTTLREAFPFGLALVFVTVFYWVDSLMLSIIKGDEIVGLYNAAYRMVFVLSFIPQAFASAIFPVMSKLYKTSENSILYSYEFFLKYMIILGIPIGLGTTILANQFILEIFGQEYFDSIIVLKILIWSAVFIFISVPFGTLFNSVNRQSVSTKITGVCVVLNIILNLILIPKYSLIGASITTVFTEFISLCLHYISSVLIGYKIPGKKLLSIFTKVSISSCVMVLFLLQFHNLNILLLIFISAVLYFMILFLTKGMGKEDISLLKSYITVNR